MNQLSTGKKISKPSDDPVIAMNGMSYRTEVTQVKQFQRNVGEVHNWFDNSDAALDKVTKTLQRVRELTVQVSNGTYDDNQKISVSKEMEQLNEHLKELANTQVNDKYIFNGAKTETPPVDKEGNITFVSTAVEMEISKGTLIPVNVNGQDVFGSEEESNVFSTIDDLVKTLNEGGDLDNFLGDLDTHINNVINTRADLGARMNRLELVEHRLGEQEVIATQMMSNNEDVDFSKAITELITQESLHRAALSAGSRIIQPTLLDFLR